MNRNRFFSASKALPIAEPVQIALIAAGICFLPFAVHLIPRSPSAVPLGAVWLPIFYAPALAAVFCRPRVAVFASLAAPALNYFLTGRPAPAMVFTLTVELLVFSASLAALGRFFKKGWANAVLACAAAKLVSSALPFFIPALPYPFGLSGFLFSMANAVPGLAVLFLINALAIGFARRGHS